jgi:hypothetical protein
MIDYSILPDHMQEGMRLYIEKGIQPGSFLTSVLENDLVRSFETADYINQHRMLDFVIFLVNQAPHNCWGSPKRVQYWLDEKGKMPHEVNNA